MKLPKTKGKKKKGSGGRHLQPFRAVLSLILTTKYAPLKTVLLFSVIQSLSENDFPALLPL